MQNCKLTPTKLTVVPTADREGVMVGEFRLGATPCLRICCFLSCISSKILRFASSVGKTF